MAPSSARRQCGWRDWANLDSGPAGLVAEHVLRNDFIDLVRFRTACRPWRACSAHLRAQGVLDRRFLPRSWIMLPRKFNKVDDTRCFLNVSTGVSTYRSLPVPDPWSSYLFGTTHEGLVLLLSTTGVGQLLNPLTGQVTGLPTAAILLGNVAYLWLWNVELLGAGLDEDDTVVHHISSYSLVIAKPGDERWTHIDSRDRITSVLPLAGRVYCATSRNILLVQTATTVNQPPKLVDAAGHELHKEFGSVDAFQGQLREGRSLVFLVENNGELILCHHAHPESQTNKKYSVSVHLVNLNAKNTVPLRGLNGKALFLGKRRSVLVATRVSPSINAGTAYLCWPRPKYVPVYAVDLLGGGCVEAKFEEVEAAYFLSCYSRYSSE